MSHSAGDRGAFSWAAAAGVTLTAVAVLMLGYRFCNRDLVAFINDEPRFLDAARMQLHGGHWLPASPLVGSVGVRYGPSVLWFYGLVQAAFGERAATAILAMTVLTTVAHLACAVALARVLRGNLVLFAVVLAFIGSSPYQFFFSRLAWDQTVIVCSAWMVVVLCGSERLGALPMLGLGVLVGVALGSHPMVLPLVAAVGVVLAAELARSPSRLAWSAALAATGTLAVLLPYLVFLSRNPQHPTPALPLSGPVLASYFAQPARVATFHGIQYFFDAAWPDFVGWLGRPAGLLALGKPLLLAVGATALLGIGMSLFSAARPQRRVAWVALLLWLGAPFLYAVRTLARHPHYQFATWWVVPFGVAAALHWLWRRSPRAGAAAAAAVLVVAFGQFLFQVEWMRYVRERQGTRHTHYGTPLGEQSRLVHELCAGPPGRLQLENLTAVFPHSLSYLAATEPQCRRLEVAVCRPGLCPAAEDARRVRLVYARERGGALGLE